jgi:hypothetical protein
MGDSSNDGCKAASSAATRVPLGDENDRPNPKAVRQIVVEQDMFISSHVNPPPPPCPISEVRVELKYGEAIRLVQGVRVACARSCRVPTGGRHEQDIESEVSEWEYNSVVPIQSDPITGDIRAYVRTRVREDKALKGWRAQSDVQKEIETRLIEKANRMQDSCYCALFGLSRI